MQATIITSTGKHVGIEINFITSYKAEIKFDRNVWLHNSQANDRQKSADTIVYNENKGNCVKFDRGFGFFDFNHTFNRPNAIVGMSKMDLQKKGLR